MQKMSKGQLEIEVRNFLWRTQDDEVKSLGEINDGHLKNIVKLMERRIPEVEAKLVLMELAGETHVKRTTKDGTTVTDKGTMKRTIEHYKKTLEIVRFAAKRRGLIE